jgi:hypothetical protein
VPAAPPTQGPTACCHPKRKCMVAHCFFALSLFSRVTTRPCIPVWTTVAKGRGVAVCTPSGQLSCATQFKMQLESNGNWHAASASTRRRGTGALQNSPNGPAPVGHVPRQPPGGCRPATRARAMTPHRPRGGGGGAIVVVAALGMSWWPQQVPGIDTPTAHGGPVCPGWLYTRGRPSLGHNSGQWMELVVAHWRLVRQMSNGF